MATKASGENKTTKVKKAPETPAKSAPVKKVAPAKVTKAPTKAVVKTVAKTETTAAPKARKASAGKTTLPSVSERQRGHYIEVAAYYIAERRNFAPGDTLADWLVAEAQVDRLIAEGKLGS